MSYNSINPKIFPSMAVPLMAMIPFIIAVPAMAAVSTIEVNRTHAATFGNLNLGLVNSTGYPIELEFSRSTELLLNAYGANYNFSDLVPLESFINLPDEPSIPDNDYFAFTQANIDESQHGLFYARWSVSAQKKPEYKTLGEDGLFVKEFTGDYNFKCPLEAGACMGMVSRYEIQDMFPDKRPLARLVYFQLMKIALFHDIANGAHDSMKDTHVYIMGQIDSIISSFTRQASANKKTACEMVQEVVKTLTEMAIKTAMSYIPQMASLEIIVGNQDLFVESIKRINQLTKSGKDGKDKLLTGKWKYAFKTGKFQDWWKTLSVDEKKGMGFGDEEAQKKIKSYSIAMDPLGKMYPYVARFFTQYDHILTVTPGLDQGYSKSVLCGGFEGDESNRNEGNKIKLMKHLSGYFVDLEKSVRDQYRAITTGHIIEEDSHFPTLQGIVGTSMRWEGPGSIMETFKNMESMRAAIASSLERQIISDVVRGDGNWATCTHDVNAQKLCSEAKKARDTNSNKVTEAVKGRFCPDSNDETMICATGRWYHQKYSSHVVPFAPLKGFQNYASTYYTMSFDQAMAEGFENYKSRKNDFTIGTQGWTLGHVKGGGMRIAFCMNDHYKLTDFGGYILAHARPGVQWELPSICGEQGTETAQFMDAIGLGIGSQPYNNKEDIGKPMQLYRDRLPRASLKFNTLSPYLSYMQYGRVGIQFPLHRDVLNLTESTAAQHAKDLLLASSPAATKAELMKAGKKAAFAIQKDPRWQLMNRWKVFTGVDSDFEMIRNVTEKTGRTEVQNNIWFCQEGQKVHTIFQRERGHIDLGSHPIMRIDSHKKKCEKWVKEHAIEIAIERANH